MSDSEVVIKVENLWKQYHYGTISHATLKKDFQSWWAHFRGKEDPNSRIDLHQAPSTKNPSLDGDSFWALEDITFDVKQGEILGIIGKNGAGKSTLLKIMSRVTIPTKGLVKIKGRVACLLEVGTGFHPELTGRENIYLNGSILGMTKAEISSRFDEIVDFAGIGEFIDTPVKRYSSGMYVRLGFSVAAHLDPEILLVDEVLAVGDAEFQKKCLGKMSEVSRGGRTVLFVSHNMLSVKKLCSKAVLLDRGKNVCLEDTSSVIEKYLCGKIEFPGEISWNSPEEAPGTNLVRLKAVRVVSDGTVNGSPIVSKDIEIQIDYWNLEKDGRRLISIHVQNAMDYMLFSSGNMKSTALVPDPWAEKEYPLGLFRTSCIIPKLLLNIGHHNITLFINRRTASDNIFFMNNVISFNAVESQERRKDYLSLWFGAVRPLLHWETTQLE
jgi:lipopolysaccharide transport system ATP-binding protein